MLSIFIVFFDLNAWCFRVFSDISVYIVKQYYHEVVMNFNVLNCILMTNLSLSALTDDPSLGFETWHRSVGTQYWK
jgi:hypothetical protein